MAQVMACYPMTLSHCLAETMLTNHQRCSFSFIWEQFRRRSWTLSVIYVHNICSKYIYASKTTATSPRGQWIKCTYFYSVSYWHKWHIDTILWRWHWQPYHSFLPKAWKKMAENGYTFVWKGMLVFLFKSQWSVFLGCPVDNSLCIT